MESEPSELCRVARALPRKRVAVVGLAVLLNVTVVAVGRARQIARERAAYHANILVRFGLHGDSYFQDSYDRRLEDEPLIPPWRWTIRELTESRPW